MRTYIFPILTFLLFNGSGNKPKHIEPVKIEIDPIDLLIDETVMEGNRLENYNACQDIQIEKELIVYENEKTTR